MKLIKVIHITTKIQYYNVYKFTKYYYYQRPIRRPIGDRVFPIRDRHAC